jgi:hypothetical protein
MRKCQHQYHSRKTFLGNFKLCIKSGYQRTVFTVGKLLSRAIQSISDYLMVSFDFNKLVQYIVLCHFHLLIIPFIIKESHLYLGSPLIRIIVHNKKGSLDKLPKKCKRGSPFIRRSKSMHRLQHALGHTFLIV